MLKLIAQNKYKLMVCIISLYLFTDVWLHKGQARVLFGKTFPAAALQAGSPKSKSAVVIQNKTWTKGVNTHEQLEQLEITARGFECDVYYDTEKKDFDVYHDADKQTGQTLKALLNQYRQKKMTAAIWLDIKNLTAGNATHVLASLLELQKEYGLQNKLLVESGMAGLLTAFSDSGFYTVYYIPMFNPYQVNDTELKSWADSIVSATNAARVNALSGYYFQYPFLQHYFPRYPVLTWAEKKPLSMVNRLFRNKLAGDTSIAIVLYP